jgi:hypothetical protein
VSRIWGYVKDVRLFMRLGRGGGGSLTIIPTS